ncbi:glycine d-amino acid oxidase (deaminating) [Fusarium sp. NRRL 52700]|nr:glycine d-amino acid oxidase (deaminating) [Fusarium sp. NRRL 52700]
MATSSFPQRPSSDSYEAVIIGGATSGSAIAWFLVSNPDFKGKVLVVEKDPSLAYSATQASNNCMRQQFATEINVKISQYAAEFVKDFRKNLKYEDDDDIPDIPIRDFGHLYLADNSGSITFKTGKSISVGNVINAAGTRTAGVSRLAGMNLPNFDDFSYAKDVWNLKMLPVLKKRVPQFSTSKATHSWMGHYEFKIFGHNAIIGPHTEVSNLLFCVVFSGHGSQQSPACGRGVAELITYGEFRTLDLSALSYRRISCNEPLMERAVI